MVDMYAAPVAFVPWLVPWSPSLSPGWSGAVYDVIKTAAGYPQVSGYLQVTYRGPKGDL